MDFLSFILLVLSVFTHSKEIREEKYLIVDPCSRFDISGSTNVNRFDCHFDQAEINSDTLRIMVFEEESGEYLLRDASIFLPVTGFDCGNGLMNKDLYQLLNADKYPEIFIEVKSLSLSTEKIVEEHTSISLDCRITIELNSIVRSYALSGYGNSSDKTLSFSANTCVHLSDFELDPPTKIMGLIQVRDMIVINMDLLLHEVNQ